MAYGEPLPKLQNELKIHGHALEARIYAEEPEKAFYLQSVKLTICITQRKTNMCV